MTLDDYEHQIGFFIDFLAIFSCDTHFKMNCVEIARDRPGHPAYETFSIKRSFYLFKFRPPCVQGILRKSDLGTLFKILAFGHSNGSIHARQWRRLAYVNTSFLLSVAEIDELGFVRSGPSNMHHCRVFPFALGRLSCQFSQSTYQRRRL